MSFDINKHYLVPKHTKITDSEKKELLEKYKINSSSLPKIQNKDPALIKMHPKVGDIVKIERKSQTAGTTVYYRIVAED